MPRAGAVGVAAGPEAPDVVTVTPARSSEMSTEPSWSVRYTRWATFRRRANVPAFGCPYLLSAPTEIAATRGCSAASRSADEAVALP